MMPCKVCSPADRLEIEAAARSQGGVAWISRQASCMAEKGPLFAITDWAVAKWTRAAVEGKYQAASVLLDLACE